jgi:predicted ATPase
VFFDRGLLDAAAALRHAGGDVAPSLLSAPLYNRQVFMTPPWPEIYTTDTQRRHELRTP